MTVAAALVVVGMLAAVASAQVVFLDDFDANPPGPLGALKGHEANTGQVWGDPIFGAADAEINMNTGQGGTNGLAITSNPPSMGTEVPLNLAPNQTPGVDGSGDIVSGQWLWSVDSHKGALIGQQAGKDVLR